jgi:hypothetical protein
VLVEAQIRRRRALSEPELLAWIDDAFLEKINRCGRFEPPLRPDFPVIDIYPCEPYIARDSSMSTCQPKKSKGQYLMLFALVSLLHLALLWWLTHAAEPRGRAVSIGQTSGAISAMLVPLQSANPAVPALRASTKNSAGHGGRAPETVIPARPASLSPMTARAARRRPATTQGEWQHDASKQALDGTQDSYSSPSSSLPLLILPDYSRDTRPRQKSNAEMASEQVNPGGARNRLAEGIKQAAVPDCASGGGLLGLPVIIYKAVNDKCR